MVLYFSATGNCKYVATRLVQSARQEMLSIVDCIQSNRYNFTDGAVKKQKKRLHPEKNKEAAFFVV